MTKTQNDLPNMPDLVLKNISEMVGAFDIQSLRKVSSRIRNYLESESPPQSYDTLSLVVESFRTNVSYTHGGSYLATCYQPSRHGSIVSSFTVRNRKNVTGEDPIELLCNDLNLNVVKFKSSIQNLIVDMEHHNASRRLIEKLPALLSSGQQLKVKKVYMTVYKAHELFLVLPYLDQNAIETIAMYQARRCRALTLSVEDMERIGNLDIWRKAKNIICQIRLASSESIHYFLHLKDFTFQLEELFVGDFIKLKESMLEQTSQFKRTQISYNRFAAEEIFIESLGPFSYPSRNGKRTWYFRHQNNMILQVVFRPHWIFIGWDNKVPQDAITSFMF